MIQSHTRLGFEIGASPRRLEDERFLRGVGCYLDDVMQDGLAHAVFVRSVHAHARVLGIDVTGAREMPGVLTVLTHAEARHDGLRALNPSVTHNPHNGEAFNFTPQSLLAHDSVRHVGEILAVVIAENAQQANDAAQAVVVDFEPLPCVVDAQSALELNAPQVDKAVPGNVCLQCRIGDVAAAEAAFSTATHVVQMRSINHRVITNSMEPRGAIAHFDLESGCYTLHASSQNVHVLRDQVALALGVDSTRVRMHATDVGGGFGNRNFCYPEYALLLWAAKRTMRSVKWVSSRSDGFISDHQARDFFADAALAIDETGRFLALRVSSVANVGAWLVGSGCGIQTGQYTTTPGGLYRIAALDLSVTAVLSNTVPVGVTRGPGFAEAINVIERLVDKAAMVTGICRIALRRRNLVAREEMPWTNAMGTRIDSGDFHLCLDTALQRAGADEFEARRRAALSIGKWRGLGIACHVKATGGLEHENVCFSFTPDRLVFTTGTMAIGQGHETSFRQILGTLLGLSPSQIVYNAGDSDQIAMGGGHGSSRATYMASTAIARACEAVLTKARPLAARALGVQSEDIHFDAGLFHVLGSNRTMGLLEVARHARDAGDPLDCYQHITREAMTFPGGCHVAEVELDPETGVAVVVSYTAVDDYGVLINPMLVSGQMHGAIAQGIGQSLLERAVYDAGNGQLLSASFMDYALPRADNLPSFDATTVKSICTTNPLGVKGCGEAGAVAGFPAVSNAIADALGAHGISGVAEPMSPEGIWRRIVQRNQSGADFDHDAVR